MSDQSFKRNGNDIHTTVTISFKQAILGDRLTVKTLAKTVTLNIPPGTQPGTRMRLKGMGLAVGDRQGDMYVEIIVEIPTTLTDAQRALLGEWEG